LGKGTRNQKTALMNKKVLDIATKSIADRGVDLTTIQLLAEKAKTSIGPVYARYESVDDLAGDVFEHRLVAHFDFLLASMRSWCFERDSEAYRTLRDEFIRPSPLSKALVEVLAVARRYPMTADLVRPTITTTLRRHVEALNDIPLGISISQATVLLGSLLLHPCLPDQTEATAEELLEMLHSANNDVEARGQKPVRIEPLLIPIPMVEAENELLTDFTNALFRVISQTGYEKASANRIARTANHGFSSIYKSFDSKEVFMESVTSVFVAQMVALNLTPFLGISRDEYIARSVTMGRTLTSEDNRGYRQLRLETVIAARHHPKIRKSLQKNFRESTQLLRQLITDHFNMDHERHFFDAETLWTLVRCNGMGISLLSATTPLMESIEWAPGSASLYNLLESRGFATPSNS
jgi:AcrR family transcriptional regulator